MTAQSPTILFQPPPLDTLGQRLLAIREHLLKVSLTTMVEMLGPGFNDSTVRTWEIGNHAPRLAHLIAKRYSEVCGEEGYDVPPSWILYGDETIFAATPRKSHRVADENCRNVA